MESPSSRRCALNGPLRFSRGFDPNPRGRATSTSAALKGAAAARIVESLSALLHRPGGGVTYFISGAPGVILRVGVLPLRQHALEQILGFKAPRGHRVVSPSGHASPPAIAGLKLHILDMALPHGKGFIGTVTGGSHVAESKFIPLARGSCG